MGLNRQTKRLAITIFLLNIWLYLPLYGFQPESPSPIPKQFSYLFKSWTIENGLPQNSILCMVLSKNGYIWLGTRSGLVRFDGVEFNTFNHRNTPNLKDDNISSLYEDPMGVLWIGTGNGLCCLENGVWKTFSTTDGLSDATVNAIARDKGGSLWIGTANGLNRLKNGKFTVYSTGDAFWGNVVTAITPASAGGCWVGTTDSGLRLVSDKKYTVINPGGILEGKEITALQETKDGLLWICTEDGLFVMEKGKITWAVPDAHPLRGNAVRALMENEDGGLWIGSDGEGIYTFFNQVSEGKLRGFPEISTPFDLHTDYICSFLRDNEGNTWVGTFAGGLYRMTRSRVFVLGRGKEIPTGGIDTVVETGTGRFALGTDRGVVRLDGGETKRLRYGKVRTLYPAPNGNLFIGTRGNGVIVVAENGNVLNRYTTREGLSSNNITTIYGGNKEPGVIWIGTTNGLNRLKQNKITVLGKGLGKTKRRPHITAITETVSEGNRRILWIGTQKGLSYIDHSDHNKDDGIMSFFMVCNGKQESFRHPVSCLYADLRGYLWAGTRAGLVCVNLTAKSIVKINNRHLPGEAVCYTINDGLPVNDIFSILEDDEEFLWMGSIMGVFRIAVPPFRTNDDSKKPLIHPICFDEKDGMKSRECVKGGQPPAWKTVDGKLCFPTVKGVAVFAPSSIRLNRTPPVVVIEEVLVDKQPLKMDEINRLSPGSTMIEIGFTAINFTAPGKVIIRYRLEGAETGWTELKCREKRQALYVGLKPGEYRFRVTACNNDGVWNHDGAVFTFEIEPFLYQQPLFYLGILLGIFVMVAGWWFYSRSKRNSLELKRDKRREKRSNEKKEKSIALENRENGKQPIEGSINTNQTEPDTVEKEKKYTTSALQPEMVEAMLPRLKTLIEEEKVYLEPDLTLKKLAERVGVHSNYLSQVINEHLGSSFNDYINKFRIEEAKLRLVDPRESEKTILEVAYDTGFYSKSVFNTAFKKFTGMTPSQFRKSNMS